MRSVQDVHVNDLGLDLGGWVLERGTDVSDDGRVNVGTGFHNGELEAWVARLSDPDPNPNVIPEPTTLVIWSLLATLGLSFYRRRRRRAF